MDKKLKAKQLVERFIPFTKGFHIDRGWVDDIPHAKQCALIACDEIINEVTSKGEGAVRDALPRYSFWVDVKKEIQQL